MTREEAITYLKVIWNRYKAEYEIERETLDAYHIAIEALTEPINCVKCKHYYETEDDTDVHGHCRMDTVRLYTHEEAWEMCDLISRADAIEAVNMLDIFPPTKDTVARELMALPSAEAEKTYIGIDIPYGSDKGIATIFKRKDDKLILEEVKELMRSWIPCSERLPSEGGFYLCTTEDCVTILEFVTGNYHYNESPSFMSDTLGRCNGYVIAWMPLPKPYREDGEQE